MGKLGAGELNYASDIDVMFAGSGDPTALDRSARRLTELARSCLRRCQPPPRGSRWAVRPPWPRTRPTGPGGRSRGVPAPAEGPDRGRRHRGRRGLRRGGGPPPCGHGCSAPTSALRGTSKAAEAEVARKGLTDREVKRGAGHQGRRVRRPAAAAGPRPPRRRPPLTGHARRPRRAGSASYVDPDDAAQLAEAYRFLRRLEHRLQLYDGTQVYAMPADEAEHTRIAAHVGLPRRQLGDRPGPARRRAGTPPGDRAVDPRAPVLPAAAGAFAVVTTSCSRPGPSRPGSPPSASPTVCASPRCGS